jgi:hypothetical protein
VLLEERSPVGVLVVVARVRGVGVEIDQHGCRSPSKVCADGVWRRRQRVMDALGTDRAAFDAGRACSGAGAMAPILITNGDSVQ